LVKEKDDYVSKREILCDGVPTVEVKLS
jgi:hypothetical protein